MPSPTARPASGSFFGPRTSSAMMNTIPSSSGPTFGMPLLLFRLACAASTGSEADLRSVLADHDAAAEGLADGEPLRPRRAAARREMVEDEGLHVRLSGNLADL